MDYSTQQRAVMTESDCLNTQSLYIYPDKTDYRLQYCNITWDGVSCWPLTLGGTMSSVSCFSELNGVRYDTRSNASRFCYTNGTWSTWANYRHCKPLKLHDEEILQVLWNMKEAATIYYVGYGVSLIALCIALFILLYFKELRCLRNTIHTNLLVTYMLIDITWILTATLQSNHNNATATNVSCFLVILLMYLMGTNFFWMFVEGLYLYTLVVKALSIEKVKFRVYLIIGWGVPAIVAGSWATVKRFHGSSSEEFLIQRKCPWQTRDFYDYVFICPVLFVLCVNIFFLVRIMWVLITKLRASNNMESEQYRKATKALLVLIPLLGVTYLLVIATPTDELAEVVFTYIQATLLSIQGFIVAVLYCFLNGEVQNSLKQCMNRWKQQSSIRRRSCSMRSANGSHRRGTKLWRDTSISFTSAAATGSQIRLSRQDCSAKNSETLV